MTRSRRADAGELELDLTLRIEALATHLTGAGPTSSRLGELRYRSRDSLSVVASGQARGSWYDFETGKGGGPLGLIAHLRRCTMHEAEEWARGWLGRPDVPRPAPITQPIAHDDETQARRKVEIARTIWRETVDLSGTPAEVYLATRKLRPPAVDALRFHPSCPLGTERWPAMVALMTCPVSGEATGVHRTYITADGKKAPVARQKMMLGRAGVIRLSANDEVTCGVGLTEGIENGLTLLQAAGWSPIWAAGSAGAIADFPVLAGIEALTIFADADTAGLKGAEECAQRWADAGREVRIAPPRGEDRDWNDVLRDAA